jgi:hypothetical protein
MKDRLAAVEAQTGYCTYDFFQGAASIPIQDNPDRGGGIRRFQLREPGVVGSPGRVNLAKVN